MFTCTKISFNNNNYYQQENNNYKFNTSILNIYSKINTYSTDNDINQTNTILPFKEHIKIVEIKDFEKDEEILTNFNINLPDFYSIEQIQEKILDKEIQKKLKKDEIEKLYEYNYMKYLNKKTKRDNEEYNNNDNSIEVCIKNENDKKKEEENLKLYL